MGFCAGEMSKYMMHLHVRSMFTHFSQHGNTRAVSQYAGKQSNWNYLFEKVAQIFSSKLKSVTIYTPDS